MGINISIKNAPEDLVARLRDRAVRNHRSLQGEVLSILSEAASRKPLSLRDVYEKGRAAGLSTRPDSVKIIRAARDAR